MTVTITKSRVLKDTDLAISMDASGVTPTVNQETGVITFSVMANVPVGDYVAVVTCGEADPLEITLTVTAPANVDGITTNPANGTISITRLNSTTQYMGIVRGTRYSQDPIEIVENTCEEPDKFDIEFYSDTMGATTGKWTRKWRIKQTAKISADVSRQFTIKFKCNDDEATFTVSTNQVLT